MANNSQVSNLTIDGVTYDLVDEVASHAHPQYVIGDSIDIYPIQESTIMSGDYIDGNTKVITESTVTDRTIWLYANPNTTYTIKCNVSSTKRVGTYATLDYNVATSHYDTVTGTGDMTVTSGANDRYLVIQLFISSDDNETLSDYLNSLQIIASGNIVTSINNQIGDVTLTYSNVGAAASSHAHGNITSGGDITATAPTIASGDQIVINDASASKITNGPTFDGSTTTTALTPKGTWETFAPLASPAFTGTPTAPTASSGDSSTQIATTAFVQNAMSGAGAGTVTSVGVSNATNGGLSVSGSPVSRSGTISIGHSNILASAQTTSGIYPIKIDKNGHITEYGNAVTIPTVPTASDIYLGLSESVTAALEYEFGRGDYSDVDLITIIQDLGMLGYDYPISSGGTVTSIGLSNATNGGLSISGSPISSNGTITIGHSNVLNSAQTTQAVYPIKIDKNGHISAYGSAVTVPTATATTPKMDGTAAVGSETNYARGDHVHPSDTSKQNTLVSGTNIKTINNTSLLGSGNIDIQGGSDNVFITEYGVTTYSDLCDALDYGKSIIVFFNGMLNPVTAYYSDPDNPTAVYLVGVDSITSNVQYTVENDDSWNFDVVDLASTDLATTTSDGLMEASDKSKLNDLVDLYPCMYGTDTFAGVLTAFQNGKMPVCVYPSSSSANNFAFLSRVNLSSGTPTKLRFTHAVASPNSGLFDIYEYELDNSGWSTNTKSLVDYVESESWGTNGGYRKWASGRAEFWYSFYADSGLTTATWQTPIGYSDTAFVSNNIWSGVFNAAPKTVTATSNHNFVFAVIPTNITKNGCNLRFLSVTNLSNSSYGFSLYAVGTWK